jgi:hypothetical protein
MEIRFDSEHFVWQARWEDKEDQNCDICGKKIQHKCWYIRQYINDKKIERKSCIDHVRITADGKGEIPLILDIGSGLRSCLPCNIC